MERRERCYLLIYFIDCELQPIAKKCWDTVPYFDLTVLFMILCSWSSPPTLIKVATNTRPCSKLGWTTLNGWKEEVSVISHRRVTSSGLKEERPVLRRSVLLVLQLVVALIWGMWLWVTRERHARAARASGTRDETVAGHFARHSKRRACSQAIVFTDSIVVCRHL